MPCHASPAAQLGRRHLGDTGRRTSLARRLAAACRHLPARHRHHPIQPRRRAARPRKSRVLDGRPQPPTHARSGDGTGGNYGKELIIVGTRSWRWRWRRRDGGELGRARRRQAASALNAADGASHPPDIDRGLLDWRTRNSGGTPVSWPEDEPASLSARAVLHGIWPSSGFLRRGID